MQPSLSAEAAGPLIEILEDLAPAPLHAAAWAACSGKGWYFGHGSNTGGWSRFWKMDLDGDAAFNAIWEHVQPRCEALAGAPLRVIRQYANGHTYGLGGEPHFDDQRAGTFTLLYYLNPEWKDGWDGETIFYDQSGEIALSVRPRPNRAVFFDSRIVHNGRAPSRMCTAVRVSVAYKLEAVSGSIRPRPQAAAPDSAARIEERGKAAPPAGTAWATVEEVERDGARRVYRAHVAKAEIQRAVEQRLEELAQSLRLPGFRPGKIPRAVLEERYGLEARAAILKRLAADVAKRALPAGSVASACELLSGADTGDMEISIAATHLPDLPDIDFSGVTIERMTMAEADLSPEAAAFLRESLKAQVLDRLDTAYSIPLFPWLIEREFSAIWKLAETQGGVPSAPDERKPIETRFHKIAERRLRLGVVVTELARRFGIGGAHGVEIEDQVIDRLVSQARVVDRPVAPEELRGLMAG
jgi:SM-20-related protein